MTEQILSPDVYLSESDKSYTPAGPAVTGIAIVGPTAKGAAFIPTDVTSFPDFTTKFGADNGTSYVPQSVYYYLQAGSTAKITRILGNGGWVYNAAKPLAAIVSGSTIVTVLYPTLNNNIATTSLNSASLGASNSLKALKLTIAGTSLTSSVVTASMLPTDYNYITKVLGTAQNFNQNSAFPYLLFNNYVSSSIGNGSYASAIASLVSTSTSCTFTSSNYTGYDHGVTPWVYSGAGTNMFGFHHLSDGFATNSDIKVSISNIIVSSNNQSVYTTFNVLVRAYGDTDKNPTILEQYIGATLDPTSANFLPLMIGDKYQTYNSALAKVVENGNYDNISSYIRVELDPSVTNGAIHPNLAPAGFRAMYEVIAGFGSNRLPAVTYVSSNTGSYVYSGFDCTNTDNLNYNAPVPLEAVTGSNVDFALPATDNKFTMTMQYGSDGINFSTPTNIDSAISANGTNVFGYDLSTSTSGGTQAYELALNILSNKELYSFNLLSLPGVIEQYHSAVTSYAQSMVESRADSVYIRDLTGVNETTATAVSVAAGLDSSYSSTYYPWVKVKSISTNQFIFVPPSVIVPQAYAYNDSVAADWFAPAGLNRGVLAGAIDTKNRLVKTERDALYSARINPICKFPTSGVVIWGQKTLQVQDTMLNRINVRRLLIDVKNYIGGTALNYVFEQNTTTTRNNLINAITPYLENIQNRQGLYAFKVQIDETLNTADVVDRNILQGKIFLSPTPDIEFVLLEFDVMPTGITF